MNECNCLRCQLRRELEEPEAPIQPEVTPVVVTYDAAMSANLRAQTIGILTDALVKLGSVNATAQAAGVRRAIDELLPKAPAKTSGETASGVGEQTRTNPQDFMGIPEEISDLAKAMAEHLGVPIDVMRFPRD